MNRWIALIALLLATPAWATDGDWVETTIGSLKESDGSMTYNDTYKLCDGATGGATKTCAVFDLAAVHTQTDGSKIPGGPRPSEPDSVTFIFRLATGCSGATTVMPMGSTDADLDPRIDLAPAAMDKPASSETDQVHLGSGNVPNRYLTADIQTGTDCTDAEVWMSLHYSSK